MKAQKPDVIDNALAPEIFATHATNFSVPTGTMVSITLASQRCVNGKFVDVVVGRLVMPIGGYSDIVRGVEQFTSALSGANSDPA